MARSPRTAQHSIEISPPTNYFSGLVSAVLERDLYMSLVSSFGVLSEFLPILLSNVPYQVTETLNVHLVSTWIAVGIMAAMVLIILEYGRVELHSHTTTMREIHVRGNDGCLRHQESRG
ncbi:hypothetical protein F5B22DRAFT_614601 [Xylaria bambusicola]|uniref:uncharacterized protein n=1 Tax=Xylaria bambusicola TaxID=326684 RepID=UPI0020082838|nr:uncharacterized protein F5B22DRAFT_614601 [Xylaria bambusicola]KAI0512611.1 hypothetical protein F5B22DRAFT_614601 [Xylaria bambusicola]